MMRIACFFAVAPVMLGLHQAGIAPTWLAATVAILAMTAATLLLALEDIG